MNQETQKLRQKRLRLAANKHTQPTTQIAFRGLDYDKISAQAADKTPKAHRVGNYYEEHTNTAVRPDGSTKTYKNYGPIRPQTHKEPGILTQLVNSTFTKLGLGVVA